MPRSHPPTLITLVRRTLVEECGPLKGRAVLAAVSGGGDSQAMLSVLGRLAPTLGFRLSAHGVDHGLRSEAGSELDKAEALATKLGVPFGRTQLALARGGNLQARAREARYAALGRGALRCWPPVRRMCFARSLGLANVTCSCTCSDIASILPKIRRTKTPRSCASAFGTRLCRCSSSFLHKSCDT